MTHRESVTTRRPGGPIYRLGRAGSVWVWPDWAYAGEDGTFGNRYDDPAGKFRVLYASSQRLGTFIEALARFRPDPHVLAAGIDEDDDYPSTPPGQLPASWLTGRAVGRATIDREFVDVGHSTTLAYLRQALAATIRHFGLDDLDAAAIRMHAPRRLTQDIAAHLYDLESDSDRPQGVVYLSRLGDDVENWAIWEPAEALAVEHEDAIAADDQDLLEAVARFGLTLKE
jgi:hypothetical protein